MKTSELKSIIRSLIKEEILKEVRVVNYKNGVTAAMYDDSVTLSHPDYGNQSYKLYGGSNRYKTPKGEFEILSLVKKFAAGELGKGERPYKKIQKPASEPKTKSEPKPTGRFRTVNYKNGVTAKVYSTAINLSHPKYGSKSFKKYPYANRYKTPKGEIDMLDLIKKFAAGEFAK